MGILSLPGFVVVPLLAPVGLSWMLPLRALFVAEFAGAWLYLCGLIFVLLVCIGLIVKEMD